MAAPLVGSLRRILVRRQQGIALALAGTVLLTAGIAPLGALVLREGPAWWSALAALSDPKAMGLLFSSLFLAAIVTMLALAIGLPLGILVGRTDVPGRWLAAWLHGFPTFLPPFLLALGWFHLFGESGLAGSAASSGILFGEVGVVCVLALTFTPIVTALTALGLQGVDASLEEAARVVASPLRVVLLILLPAAAPAWALAAILVFTLSFSELGVPMFLRVDTYPAAVFSRLGGVDFAPGEALALVLPLLPLALLLLAVERRFVGARSYEVLGLRSRREPISLGRWRWVATLVLWSAALVSVAPLAALAWRAISGGGLAGVGPWLGRAPWTSLSTAAVAATLIVALGAIVGHAAARRLGGAAALDAAAVLAFVAPAAVLGVGLIELWNRPALQWIYGGAGMLVVGCVARYGVLGVRTVGCLVAQTPRHLEEAAAAAGASYWRRVSRVLLPLHVRGLTFAWLLALVFCLRDLELSVLYYPPGGQPLTVRLFTLEANGPEPVVAGLALVHVAITAAVLAAGGLLLRRSE